MIKIKPGLFFIYMLCCMCSGAQQIKPLQVSANLRYFQTSDGNPFFWLGDTGWLLFSKTKKAEVIHYLETRKKQGFNVIQIMVLHEMNEKNSYGGNALINGEITTPVTQENPYNYWSYIEFVITEASKRGIYIALVPIWGGAAKSGKVTGTKAAVYAKFLVERFAKYDNIIWLNGGDIKGNELPDVWNAIGNTLLALDSKHHLIGFHPRGRYSSSEWFHNEAWLDFNMFQSGHRSYELDTSRNDKYHFGEDNWKYVNHDYGLSPNKPTFDGEPSYENIPQGLHDSLMPRWKAADIRRYAYWSVFAGGAGFTYGENAVMQFYKTEEGKGAYGVNQSWTNTIHAQGASQLKFLKALLLSRPYFERIPAPEIIADNQYEKYDYIIAAKGKKYAMAYVYTGRNFSINTDKLGFTVTVSQWFSPSTGMRIKAAYKKEKNQLFFDPPGNPKNGNDWVLVLDGK